MSGNSGDSFDDEEMTRVEMVPSAFRDPPRKERDRAYLIVLAGSNVGEMYRLEQAEVVIGRASGASIRLDDDGVSRRHARILVMGDEVIIEDLRSSNGTHVNGDPVSQASLKDGDKIRLGSTTVLKFTYHDHLDESFQQQMYEAALRDGLTKAFNKKYFLDRIETEFAFAKRHQTPLSVVMLDVDHFKQVNDKHGHLAGDFVLQRLARIAQGTVRTEDVFARYGGEEFGVICRGVPLTSAGILGERIRAMVASAPFENEGLVLPITVSVGVAAFPDSPVASALELVAAADEALYVAKRSGRNRVQVRRG